MLNKIIGLSGLFILLVTSQVFSQGQGNSPYSVFGLGEPASMTNITQDAMGGTGVSFGNTFYVNFLNPAMLVKNRSIGAYKYVAFSVGLKGRSATIQNATTQQQDLGMNLNHISMAFPIKPNWASGVTLLPTTIVDHSALQLRPIAGTTNDVVTYNLESNGGLTRVAWTNSFKVGKGLYLGLDAAYNFGTTFRDTTSSLGTGGTTLLRNTERTSLNGYSIKPGFTYQQKLSDKWQLNVGGTYEFNTKLNGERLRTFSTLADVGNGAVLVKVPDTLSIANVSATLPSNYRIGVSLESPYKWVFALEYASQQYSNFRGTDGRTSAFMQDSQEINAGIELLPNSTSTKYFNQVFYRVGFRTAETPYVISGMRVNDTSVSLGFSFPLGFRNPSYLDTSVSFGRRGSIDGGLIQENYIKFGVSTSLLSAWFIQPRID
ncbi:MAG: hypothetical protein NWP83_07480 [Spirosomaceae bacterium]|nr:hypothetical protein [Spirosomataceae bacterium]